MSNEEVLVKTGKRQTAIFRACFKERITGKRGNNWKNLRKKS